MNENTLVIFFTYSDNDRKFTLNAPRVKWTNYNFPNGGKLRYIPRKMDYLDLNRK